MAGEVTADEVRQQLKHLCETVLRRAKFSRSLLVHLTDQTLQKNSPTEKQIAAHFFGSWTPEKGEHVRVTISRLNKKLKNYYKGAGFSEPVTLEVEGTDGYSVKAKHPKWPSIAQPPETSASPPLKENHTFFFGNDGALCIVTGQKEDVDWYPLDEGNFSIGTMIPLCGRLRTHLNAMRTGKHETLWQELSPRRLTEKLAPRYFREWKVAYAYGCAALAFYMGMPPFGNDQASEQLFRLCDVIHYARHRFIEPLLHQVIQAIALPYLIQLHEIDPVAGARIALQFTALLEESGYYEDAETALKLAVKLSKHASEFLGRGSQNAFVLKRRQAQLHAERKPDDRRFDYLLEETKEHVVEHEDRRLTLDVVQVHKALRLGIPGELEKAHQILLPLISHYQQKYFINGKWVLPLGLGAADFSEIFMLDAITTSRLQPGGWKDRAAETTLAAQKLMKIGPHTLPVVYGEFIDGVTTRSNLKVTRLLQESVNEVRKPLRALARGNIAFLIKHIEILYTQRKRYQ
jgi:hypothetical protein